MTQSRSNRPLHRLALLTAVATFPLIFMGGLVTSHGAGMSVPDWPNSYGYNMFTFPPSLWIGGIFYEHTHRLMGTAVGMLSIALAIVAWRTEPRRWIRWLAVACLFAVILQGVLGGLRVVLVKLDLAIVHACFAQAFFCLAALCAVVTSKWWIEAPDLSRSAARESGRRLAAACGFAVVLIFSQLIVGAMMRHYRAGLAVPDFPLAYGQLLPSTNDPALTAINDHRAWDLNLEPVTAGQIWLHLGHRAGSVLVTLAIAAVAWIVVRWHRDQPALLRPVMILVVLLVIQITLGALTVLWRKPADVASAHVAVGALTLMTAFVLTVRSARLFVRRREAVGFPINLQPQDRPGRLAVA
ncbi:MAG: COX15/CtaA family protein [Tepidisphaeraceae bacterium]